MNSDVRNNISSPRYIYIFKQGWFKSNYIGKKPENFDNPVEFGFGGSQPHCEIPGCKNVAIIKCSWCQKSLCLKHFFNDYHFCSTIHKYKSVIMKINCHFENFHVHIKIYMIIKI